MIRLQTYNTGRKSVAWIVNRKMSHFFISFAILKPPGLRLFRQFSPIYDNFCKGPRYKILKNERQKLKYLKMLKNEMQN